MSSGSFQDAGATLGGLGISGSQWSGALRIAGSQTQPTLESSGWLLSPPPSRDKHQFFTGSVAASGQERAAAKGLLQTSRKLLLFMPDRRG